MSMAQHGANRNHLLRYFWFALGLFALPCSCPAHRLDEYLQATLVSIEPGGVQLHINLTPGVAVAEQVLSRIDLNRDGLISTAEAIAYSKILQHDLVLRLDRRKSELKLVSYDFPTPAELRTGLAVIQLEFLIKSGSFATGAHRLTLKNRHLHVLSVYLFNAAQPTSASVHILRQKRNNSQSTGEIEFMID